MRSYIEERNGGMYVGASRVTLESIIYAFWQGESPEAIRTGFPSLTLEQIYGVITEYLANRVPFDECLEAVAMNLEITTRDYRDAHARWWRRTPKTFARFLPNRRDTRTQASSDLEARLTPIP